jgi:hypothetical protein
VIRDGRDGLLAPCGEIGELAEAIATLHGDSELGRTLGAAGRDRLPIEFRWEDKLALVRTAYAKKIIQAVYV